MAVDVRIKKPRKPDYVPVSQEKKLQNRLTRAKVVTYRGDKVSCTTVLPREINDYFETVALTKYKMLRGELFRKVIIDWCEKEKELA